MFFIIIRENFLLVNKNVDARISCIDVLNMWFNFVCPESRSAKERCWAKALTAPSEPREASVSIRFPRWRKHCFPVPSPQVVSLASRCRVLPYWTPLPEPSKERSTATFPVSAGGRKDALPSPCPCAGRWVPSRCPCRLRGEACCPRG